MWLFVILVVVPIIEIALFIQLGGVLGFWPTIAIVVLTAFIGSTLIRSQGLKALMRVQQSLGGGDDPIDSLAHGALIVVSGLVLVTPGFFTDAVGFSLLIPQVRGFVIRTFGEAIAKNVHVVNPGDPMSSQDMGGPRPGQPRAGEDVIEGEFTRIDPDGRS